MFQNPNEESIKYERCTEFQAQLKSSKKRDNLKTNPWKFKRQAMKENSNEMLKKTRRRLRIRATPKTRISKY